jgi:hypothetical protein
MIRKSINKKLPENLAFAGRIILFSINQIEVGLVTRELERSFE